MPDKFVVNASPLILLAGIGGVDWVGRLSPVPISIPRAVVDEMSAGPGGAELVGSLSGNPRFEDLVARKMYLSGDLIAAALREVGE